MIAKWRDAFCAASATGGRRTDRPDMQFTLAQVQAATGAQLTAAVAGEIPVSGWSIDSRTVAPGDLFFAIKGEHLDGHAFVDAVLARGAAAAVVSERSANGPLLLVQDTLLALQSVARWARRQWDRPIVAVTGSAGKTSTKDIIAALLGVRFKVGKNEGNLNNHIGLPLSILRLPDDAEVAVLEMGMNHAGEIRQLVSIAEPRHGVVTNVGYAHIENFASIDGIAAAKRELIEGLPADGVAILNADDALVAAFAASHAGRSLTYGFNPAADIRAVDAEIAADHAAFTVEGVRFHTALAGGTAFRTFWRASRWRACLASSRRRWCPPWRIWRPAKCAVSEKFGAVPLF